MTASTVYICGAKRTPIGKFQGQLAGLSAPELGAAAIQGALADCGMDNALIEDVIMGNVLTAGIGQAPARQACIKAGLSQSTRAVTVNKVCGSGMYAIIQLANSIRLGDAKAGVAGGQESMSNAPYLLPNARAGYRLGHGELKDSVIHDGLWDPYDDHHMGNCGEICAEKFDLSRDAQDAYALESYTRAQAAWEDNTMAAEVTPIAIPQRKGDPITVAKDEEPFSVSLDKIKKLRAAFKKDGTVTAGNASSINDGAAALVLASEETVSTCGCKPIAKITGHAFYAAEPKWFTTAPIYSMKALLEKTGVALEDVDLFEINEAFSVVPMVAIKELGLDPAKVNVMGGAVSIGHPIGASGARIVVTLINALRQQKKKRGIAAICIGGGEAASIMIEMC